MSLKPIDPCHRHTPGNTQVWTITAPPEPAEDQVFVPTAVHPNHWCPENSGFLCPHKYKDTGHKSHQNHSHNAKHPGNAALRSEVHPLLQIRCNTVGTMFLDLPWPR